MNFPARCWLAIFALAVAVNIAALVRDEVAQGSGAAIQTSLRPPFSGGQGVGAVQANARLSLRPKKSGREQLTLSASVGLLFPTPRHARAVPTGRASRPDSLSGGPLSPCPGFSHFDNRYRATYSGGLVHRGCATAYSQTEYLDGGGYVACGGRLDDRAYTTAVSANVPILNDSRGRIRCGLRVKVCGARCVVVKVNDRGPYVLGDGGDFGRDFDLSYAAALRIGKSARAWGDPVLVWWRVCGWQTPIGATRCSL